MISITARAAKELAAIWEMHAANPEQFLRLAGVFDGRLFFSLDREREEDEVVRGEGGVVLVIDADLASTFAGATIDCIDTPDGARLTIDR